MGAAPSRKNLARPADPDRSAATGRLRRRTKRKIKKTRNRLKALRTAQIDYSFHVLSSIIVCSFQFRNRFKNFYYLFF